MMDGFTWLDWAMVVFISLVVVSGFVGFIWAVFFDKNRDEDDN